MSKDFSKTGAFAECTWGDGPDVLLVVYGKPVRLLEAPKDFHVSTCGRCYHAHISLASHECEELIQSLQHALKQAKDLESSLDEYMAKEKENV